MTVSSYSANTTEALEKKVLKIIENSGKEGILQSQLIKMLGVNSRLGSKIVTRLVKRGLIKRDKVTVNGRMTYRLYLVDSGTPSLSIAVDVSSILDIPCSVCPYRKECGVGNLYEPATCPWLERWIAKLVEPRRGQDSSESSEDMTG
ncbi:helix-turn-helix transcriptional regulator [Stetteria hydrogenophila]